MVYDHACGAQVFCLARDAREVQYIRMLGKDSLIHYLIINTLYLDKFKQTGWGMEIFGTSWNRKFE